MNRRDDIRSGYGFEAPRDSGPDASRVAGSAALTISRRRLLVAGAAATLLTACGSNKTPSAGPKPKIPDSLLSFFGGAGALRPGIPQRLTFGIGDSNGILVSDTKQHDLLFHLYDDHDRPVGPPTPTSSHSQGLPRAYYPVTATFPDAGNYHARTTYNGEAVDAAFEIDTVANVKLPELGDPMPVLTTPTASQTMGVDPICTQQPACPLHDVSLDRALQSHRPVALLVATPAYCQVAICGPVLDVLLSWRTKYGSQIDFIHAEVYANGAEAAKNLSSAQLSPTVTALHLPFEPCLVVANASGIVTDRLDTIFDRTEVEAALVRAVA